METEITQMEGLLELKEWLEKKFDGIDEKFNIIEQNFNTLNKKMINNHEYYVSTFERVFNELDLLKEGLKAINRNQP